jgi:hypothetical protein
MVERLFDGRVIVGGNDSFDSERLYSHTVIDGRELVVERCLVNDKISDDRKALQWFEGVLLVFDGFDADEGRDTVEHHGAPSTEAAGAAVVEIHMLNLMAEREERFHGGHLLRVRDFTRDIVRLCIH